MLDGRPSGAVEPPHADPDHSIIAQGAFVAVRTSIPAGTPDFQTADLPEPPKGTTTIVDDAIGDRQAGTLVLPLLIWHGFAWNTCEPRRACTAGETRRPAPRMLW